MDNASQSVVSVTPSSRELRGLVVVFVGAENLSSLKAFLEPSSETDNLAFIVCPHGPVHSQMKIMNEIPDCVAKRCSVVEETKPLEPGIVYIDPPLSDLVYENGELKVAKRNHIKISDGASSDKLLKSLCVEGPRCSVVILSGVKLGTLPGLEDIANEGGQVLIDSALEISDDFPLLDKPGVVTLDAKAMLPVLVNTYADQMPSTSPEGVDLEEALLEDLLKRVELTTQIDFRPYKLPTIRRRIANRLKQLGLDGLDDYINYVESTPNEIQTLYENFMIGVTRFFRDKEAFQAMYDKVIPELFARHKDGSEVRIWVPGCATGEEAYSIAILCDEYSRAHPEQAANYKIFATDAHMPAIEKAKLGYYGRSSLENMETSRVERYFVRNNRHYQIAPEIRNRVVFASHNLLADPPFTKIDFISCRNLLIYFKDAAQKKTMGLMLFSMVGGAYLCLGPTESPSFFFEYLEPSVSKWRIYRKRKDAKPPLPVSQKFVNPRPKPELPPEVQQLRGNTPLRNLVEDVMERNMPDSVIVDGRGLMLHTFGNCERYLSRLTGKVSLSFTDRLLQELRSAAGLVVARARDTGMIARYEDCEVEDLGMVTLVAEALPRTMDYPDAVHLAFHLEKTEPNQESTVSGDQNPEVQSLRIELQDAKLQLQQTINQLEHSNNDLHVANEELMTSNEELQSTNEELQSVNEELFSVNAEFEQKNSDLVALNEDVNNLLQTTEIGTVFVDDRLRIRKFTPAASSAMHLLETDLGRPLAHIAHMFEDYSGLTDDVTKVVESGNTLERELRTKGGRWILVRIIAFKTESNDINGAVITFIDIDALKSAESHILENQRKLTLALEAADFGLWSWDLEHGVEEYDDRFFTILGLAAAPDEVREKYLRSIQFGPQYQDRFEVEAIRGTFHHSWSVALRDGSRRYLSTRGIMYRNDMGETIRLGGVIWDETDIKQKEQLILRKKTDLETLLYVISHDLREPLRAVRSFSKLLVDRESETMNPDSQDFLHRIDAGAARMARLLDDVLDLSRINNVDMPKVRVSAGDLVSAAIKPLESKINETGASVFVSSDLPDLNVNFVYAKQAIYNLVANALKFSGEDSSPKIEITPYLNSVGTPTGLVVRDEGVGVPEDCRERIFKLFQRAVGRDVEGTGAGLAIVKQIAQKHGGDAWHDPRPEGGSKFVISFS